MPDDLPILYQKIAHLTSPFCQNGTKECAKFAERKYRCCSREHCEEAARFALEKHGVTLQETGNPELPFMGDNGCTVAPHLRPRCALHVCSYSWAEKEITAPEGYEELRNQIIAEARAQGKDPFECQ